ncbi:MAG: type II toxin-antitoxin system prevent-host-death family antitoxin [Cyanobacteria bacterium P01_C01_bin.72]
MKVDFEQAQANFSEFLEKAELGEQIVITIEGVPKAILSKYVANVDSPWGRYAGKIKISDDFNCI